jgi:hypothetical protein
VFPSDRGLRLVVEDELVARNGEPQIMLQRVALPQMPIHDRLEKPRDLAPVSLGAIERGICVG